MRPIGSQPRLRSRAVIRYALIRRQQSYTSVTQVVATTYVLVCPPEVSGEAMRILGTSSEV